MCVICPAPAISKLGTLHGSLQLYESYIASSQFTISALFCCVLNAVQSRTEVRSRGVCFGFGNICSQDMRKHFCNAHIKHIRLLLFILSCACKYICIYIRRIASIICVHGTRGKFRDSVCVCVTGNFLTGDHSISIYGKNVRKKCMFPYVGNSMN